MTPKSYQLNGAFTVIFLLDNLQSPTRIGYLKRAGWKKIAPNWLTGIGGHIEHGETAHFSALREMQEEIGIDNLPLTEFAQAILPQEEKSLHYFFGIYPHKNLPECNEGSYAWESIGNIPENIIGSTYHLLNQWQSHNWNLKARFTSIIKILNIVNGDISLNNRVPIKTYEKLIIPADYKYFDGPPIFLP